jgi:hypothetical protein
MAQPQTDGMMQMLDPFGFWKTSRDSSLEAWSKIMIDMVNSEEYARSTGMILDQYLAMSQPLQDAVQKAMTGSLAYLNMPTRAEVISLAERLVNIETRLDDLDAKTSDMRDDYRTEARTVESGIDKALKTIMARLDGLEAVIARDREKEAAIARDREKEAAIARDREKEAAKPEPKGLSPAKPEPRAETKK